MPVEIISLGEIIPHAVYFSYPGVIQTGSMNFVWECPFTTATIQDVRLTTGRSTPPLAQAVIVDVNKWNGATWTTIYTTQGNRPRVLAGVFLGDPTTPDVTALVEGDALAFDIDQTGGGATPTDEDLVIHIKMLVST